jgi:hypothetical protein
MLTARDPEFKPQYCPRRKRLRKVSEQGEESEVRES